MDKYLSHHGLHRFDSEPGRARLTALRHAIDAGREAYLLGFNTGSHNAGVALIRVSERGYVELICNEEEERYTAVKRDRVYPERSIEAVKQQMVVLGLEPKDIIACLGCFEYAAVSQVVIVRPVLEEAPASIAQLTRKFGRRRLGLAQWGATSLAQAPTRLGYQLGLDARMPIIGMRHHDAHAYFSYAVSPFATDTDPVMVFVSDSGGDDSCLSLYNCEGGRLELLSARAPSQLDSIGAMYELLSATQGGWSQATAEGRYMGAAAWGDGNRLTNRYYRRLKDLFYFGPDGEVWLNRALANWTRSSWDEPYTEELVDILGEPVRLEDMWHPDAILNVEDIRHPEVTRDRVDKAAAVQMVFEDAVFHIVDYLIRLTGSHRLVWAGGSALNCVATMRLLECFDEHWYKRNLGQKNKRLHIWVPPVPDDRGAPAGAAYAFAMRAGARPGPPLRHAFYCGLATPTSKIRAAVNAEPTAGSTSLGDCSDPGVTELVADLLAHIVADDCIMGLYQGVAETGPRALGHRSIIANPCNPDTRRLLNERVKHRELIRPLAPMLTHAAAERFFYLEEGASDDDYNVYNYMVLTARARPEAYEVIPAVIHYDGTGRLQIVRPEIDPFCHEYLVAMGRRVGAEASVNTSLNVGAPIAHTPEQAITTLKRAHGMDGMVMIGSDQHATLVWLEDRVDVRERLMESVRAWTHETGLALPDDGFALSSA
jgi:carbamoyltransferase